MKKHQYQLVTRYLLIQSLPHIPEAIKRRPSHSEMWLLKKVTAHLAHEKFCVDMAVFVKLFLANWRQYHFVAWSAPTNACPSAATSIIPK